MILGCGGALCTVGFLAASLASAYRMPALPPPTAVTTKNASVHCLMCLLGARSLWLGTAPGSTFLKASYSQALHQVLVKEKIVGFCFGMEDSGQQSEESLQLVFARITGGTGRVGQ